MRTPAKRTLVAVTVGLALAGVGALGVPWLVRACLNHSPDFYKNAEAMPPARQKAGAKRLVAQGLQLRNDIVNEPSWEAAFTDEEVNAWLAADLVDYFADQIPPGVRDPRLEFEDGKVTLAFRLDRGRLHSVMWVVARIRMVGDNELSVTLEKIRAGIVPVPADEYVEMFARHARGRGLDVRLEKGGEFPTAVIGFRPDRARDDVVLERLRIAPGEVRLAGRSNRGPGGRFAPKLPKRQVLQSNFPRRNSQGSGSRRSDGPPPATARIETKPAS